MTLITSPTHKRRLDRDNEGKLKKPKIETEESESESESELNSTQTTVQRYQQLKEKPKDETFRCIDLLRDRSSGDSNGVILIPNSTITKVEEYFFQQSDKKGKISASTSQRNPSKFDSFDFIAWRIKYGTDAYELDDEWEQGQPRKLKIPFKVEIDGETYDAMSPEDFGKWENYELLVDDLDRSLDFTITHRYFVEFEFDC
jgi:hypothetical protein